MNKKNLDQALAALSDALSSQEPNSFETNPLAFIEKLPKRSLSGDHIYAGKILKFASAGISDLATTTQLTITDQEVSINALKITSITDNVEVQGKITATTVKADVIEAGQIIGDIKFEKNQNIEFGGKDITGKGIIWTGSGSTKQLLFQGNPDRLFSSEIIDIGKGKHLSINGVKIIDDTELGPSVIKSNLREVGKLKGLIVDGSVTINNYLFYNGTSDRLGIGTDEPNATLSVAEDAIEVMLGTREGSKGIVGTFASHSFDIVTDNLSRVSISSNGNIQLGNIKQPPVQVSMHGKLAIKVNMPDPEVDLHVNGAVKFNGKLQKYDTTYPTAGFYNQGDIIWNSEPKINYFVGWICLQAGEPGVWAPFGKIGT